MLSHQAEARREKGSPLPVLGLIRDRNLLPRLIRGRSSLRGLIRDRNLLPGLIRGHDLFRGLARDRIPGLIPGLVPDPVNAPLSLILI